MQTTFIDVTEFYKPSSLTVPTRFSTPRTVDDVKLTSLGQAAHTHVPLSPISIIWYRPIGSDALQLGK